MTEVWFRNPHNYIRELVEAEAPFRVAWDRGTLVKRRIDPIAHAEVYFGKDTDFDVLAIGPQGTAHLDANHTLAKPKAVYPTWEFGENFNILEEMVSSPIGMDPDACMADVPLDERPVVGQDHRVVVTNLPNAQVASSRSFYRHLAELQEEYPECTLHLHGSYSYRVMFGMGFGAADVEPRTDAASGRVVLPNGKTLAYARTVGHIQWINLLGTSVTDLKNPKPRCIFNIKSALWASENWGKEINFASRGSVDVDPDDPNPPTPTTKSHMSKFQVGEDGDKITCDTCSLQDSCKHYRDGAVCSLPSSETSALAKAFNSRDSGKIIDGLGAVLAAQANRVERGMEAEDDLETLDPEVSKNLNSLFANGVKLAKLVDPTLSKPLVQINNGKAVQGAALDMKEVTAEIVRRLEAKGIKREDMTDQDFFNELQLMAGNQDVVPGELSA